MLGPTDGAAEGGLVGSNDGASVGSGVAAELGNKVGDRVGKSDGVCVGLVDDDMLGSNDGCSVVNAATADGAAVGVLEGSIDGVSVGAMLGSIVGVAEGERVGNMLGDSVGSADGKSEGCSDDTDPSTVGGSVGVSDGVPVGVLRASGARSSTRVGAGLGGPGRRGPLLGRRQPSQGQIRARQMAGCPALRKHASGRNHCVRPTCGGAPDGSKLKFSNAMCQRGSQAECDAVSRQSGNERSDSGGTKYRNHFRSAAMGGVVQSFLNPVTRF